MDQGQKLTLAPTECLHAMLQSAVFLVTVACDVQHTWVTVKEGGFRGCGKMPAVPYKRAASAARKEPENVRLQPRFNSPTRREDLRFHR
jgi:hypothetical protein